MLDKITDIIPLISESIVLLGFIIVTIVKIKQIGTGVKCLLRSEMLRIYYHNKDKEVIRQYEYEAFVLLYEAYKALKGNSFIDKIYDEVKTWEVIS